VSELFCGWLNDANGARQAATANRATSPASPVAGLAMVAFAMRR